jgi:hypothetical protein
MVLQELIRVGADVNSTCTLAGTADSPLLVSCRYGKLKCAELLLAQPGIDVNYQVGGGRLLGSCLSVTSLARDVQ